MTLDCIKGILAVFCSLYYIKMRTQLYLEAFKQKIVVVSQQAYSLFLLLYAFLQNRNVVVFFIRAFTYFAEATMEFFVDLNSIANESF